MQVGAADGGRELLRVGGRVAAGEVVEMAIPFQALDAKPHDELRLWMTFEFAGVTFARAPRDGTVAVTVPWPGWEDENWSV